MSTLVINTIQGKTTAGSVNIRGEGSNNTNLQQGLIKAWTNFSGISTTAERDSFNISSYTDVTTGATYPITFTTNMGNADYVGSYYQNGSTTGTDYNHFNNGYAGGFGSKTTASFGVYSHAAGSGTDAYANDVMIAGDLA